MKRTRELGYDRPEKIYGVLHNQFKPSYETLMDIFTRFPEVNANWLLRAKATCS